MDQYGRPEQNPADPSDSHELDLADGDLSHVLAIGSAVGIAVFFVLVTLIALASTSLDEALVIAIVPAIVAGPFVGSVLALGILLTRREHTTEVIAIPAATSERRRGEAA